MFRELEDIFGYFIPKERSIDWLIESADDAVDNDVGVKDGELLLQFKWNRDISFLDVLVALNQDLMSLLVLSILLLR